MPRSNGAKTDLLVEQEALRFFQDKNELASEVVCHIRSCTVRRVHMTHSISQAAYSQLSKVTPTPGAFNMTYTTWQAHARAGDHVAAMQMLRQMVCGAKHVGMVNAATKIVLMSVVLQMARGIKPKLRTVSPLILVLCQQQEA